MMQKSIKKAIYTIVFVALLHNNSLAASYEIKKGSDILGEVISYQVAADETFYSIGRKFDLGIVEMMAANPGIDPWIPDEGSIIHLPTGFLLPKAKHEGILINLSELRLFYFKDAKTILTFPVGIGREGWQTPLGQTSIILKRKNPSWTPPQSILDTKPDLPKFVPAGPDNPLGAYALSLGWESFAIHGTNKPHGIGLRSSHGCIRMYPEDIETLFHAVKKGTKVTVIDTPYKIGQDAGAIYLEVTPTQKQIDDIANRQEPTPLVPADIYHAIDAMLAANKNSPPEINWQAVDEAIIKRTGLPVLISQ